MSEGRRVQGQGFGRERGGGFLRRELIGESDMFCPRCGSQNTDATKYCRQCGLPLAQVSDYVAAGGTGAIARPPAPPLPETSEMLALKQQRILTILGVCIAPVVFAILADEVCEFGELRGMPSLLVRSVLRRSRIRYML